MTGFLSPLEILFLFRFIMVEEKHYFEQCCSSSGQGYNSPFFPMSMVGGFPFVHIEGHEAIIQGAAIRPRAGVPFN